MRRENGTSVKYLTRYYIIPNNQYFNIYLHNIHRSDMDKELHCHPWDSVSILLKGTYLEEEPLHYRAWIHENNRQTITRVRDTSYPIFRKATTIHKIKLRNSEEIWTLFITGPVVRDWYFWCPKGPRVNTEYLSSDGLSIGKGCD